VPNASVAEKFSVSGLKQTTLNKPWWCHDTKGVTSHQSLSTHQSTVQCNVSSTVPIFRYGNSHLHWNSTKFLVNHMLTPILDFLSARSIEHTPLNIASLKFFSILPLAKFVIIPILSAEMK
jgi:hypothetical protein